MWISKNGAIIEDSQKYAFEITKEIYRYCEENDEEFKKYLVTKQKANIETASQILEIFKKLKEFI